MKKISVLILIVIVIIIILLSLLFLNFNKQPGTTSKLLNNNAIGVSGKYLEDAKNNNFVISAKLANLTKSGDKITGDVVFGNSTFKVNLFTSNEVGSILNQQNHPYIYPTANEKVVSLPIANSDDAMKKFDSLKEKDLLLKFYTDSKFTLDSNAAACNKNLLKLIKEKKEIKLNCTPLSLEVNVFDENI